MNFLNVTAETQNCIACVLPCNTVTKCCRASICEECCLEWLRRKRECMHCKQDQLNFDDWVAHYRDPDLIPNQPSQPQQQELILLQGVLHYYVEGSPNDSDENSEEYYENDEFYVEDIQQMLTQSFFDILNNENFVYGNTTINYASTIDANAMMQLVSQIFN